MKVSHVKKKKKQYTKVFRRLQRVHVRIAAQISVWCSADRVEWALIQLLLFDAQLTHPGQQLRRGDEQTGAQQEGKHVGFLSEERRSHCLPLCATDDTAAVCHQRKHDGTKPSHARQAALSQPRNEPTLYVGHLPQGSNRQWALGSG